MFKQISLSLAALALLASCSIKEDRINCQAPVTVRVSDFSMLMEEFPGTKATAVSDYSAVKFLTLAFYKPDGTQAYNLTQNRDDATTYTTFGEFSCNLNLGDYTMVVIGYAGTSPFTLTSKIIATCTDERLQDTFLATEAISVSDTSPLDLSATLHRVVSRLGVRSTDGRPAAATKIRMTFSRGGRNFNPTDGSSATNTGFANTIPFSAAVGNTTASASFLFLYSDEDTQDVTLEVLDDEDHVLRSETVKDVPLRRNRFTLLEGQLFTAFGSAGSFLIESGWLEDEGPIAF